MQPKAGEVCPSGTRHEIETKCSKSTVSNKFACSVCSPGRCPAAGCSLQRSGDPGLLLMPMRLSRHLPSPPSHLRSRSPLPPPKLHFSASEAYCTTNPAHLMFSFMLVCSSRPPSSPVVGAPYHCRAVEYKSLSSLKGNVKNLVI